MSLSITCSSCQRALQIEDRYVDQLVRCPVCQAQTLATSQLGADPPTPSPEIELPRETDDTVVAWLMEVPEGRVYGPVLRPELDKWVAAGRVTGDCRLQREGNPWCRADQIYPVLRLPDADDRGGLQEETGGAGMRASTSSRPGGRALKSHRGPVVLSVGILGSVFFFIPVFSVMAWQMGNADLQEMRSGKMDPSGVGLTRAGQLLGIIHAMIFAILLVIAVFGFLVVAIT